MMTTTTTTTTRQKRARPRLSLLALAPLVIVAGGARALVVPLANSLAAGLVQIASIQRIDARCSAPALSLGATSAVRAAEAAAPSVANDGPRGARVRSPMALASMGTSHAGGKGFKGGASGASGTSGKEAVAAGPPGTDQARANRALRSPPIFISNERLRRLGPEQLTRVGATTAVDEHGNPAGVRLSGVGALGVGLVDGDVVTHIDGRPTPTADDATAAGFAAWNAHSRTAHATIVRAGETIAVTLEIPTLDLANGATRAASGSTRSPPERM